MTIYTLIENIEDDNKNLNFEHGFSVYITTENGNILFDTGESGNFIENASKIGVDLSKTDYLILSHAHYDHCGGVLKFYEKFSASKLLVSKYFFENSKKYRVNKSTKRYIGIDFDKETLDIKGVDISCLESDIKEVLPNIYLVGNFERKTDFEPLNEELKVGEDLHTDDFKEEVCLVIDTSKGLFVIVGCSHPGIINILESIKKRFNKNIFGLIGGTHLKEADKDRILHTAELFNEYGIELLGVSHCTGDLAIEILKENCKNFFLNNTGKIIKL